MRRKDHGTKSVPYKGAEDGSDHENHHFISIVTFGWKWCQLNDLQAEVTGQGVIGEGVIGEVIESLLV